MGSSGDSGRVERLLHGDQTGRLSTAGPGTSEAKGRFATISGVLRPDRRSRMPRMTEILRQALWYGIGPLSRPDHASRGLSKTAAIPPFFRHAATALPQTWGDLCPLLLQLPCLTATSQGSMIARKQSGATHRAHQRWDVQRVSQSRGYDHQRAALDDALV